MPGRAIHSVLMILTAAVMATVCATSAQTQASDPPEPLPAQPQPDWMNDPFQHLQRQMGDVAGDLGDNKTDEPVQRKEQQIISDLDLLIALLEQANSGGGSGAASSNPSRPMQDSTLAPGPGGQGELRDPTTSRRNWGDLPPREREKILQSTTEGFPAGYEDLLEDYFRKLSEEQLITTLDADLSSPDAPVSDPPANLE